MRLQHRSERGVSPLLLIMVTGSVLLGGTIGVGSRLATVESSSGTLALTPVAYATCPAGPEIGQFHRGDRVLSTGRDASGDWLEVRDPGDLGGRVWVEAQFVVADGATNGLPVHECAVTPTTPTTPTTQPGSPGTPGPGGGPGGGGGPPAADTTGPQLGAIGATPADIYLQYAGGQAVCTTQVTSALSVPISDASGVASASFAWSFNTYSGTGGLSNAGGTWTGTLGPFPFPTYDAPVQTQITVAVTATDNAGNTASRSRTVTMHSAADCAP